MAVPVRQVEAGGVRVVEDRVGALGVSLGEFGQVVQAIAECLIDRGYTKEQIISRMRDTDNFDEPLWWEQHGGDIIDNFADFIDLTAFPEDDE